VEKTWPGGGKSFGGGGKRCVNGAKFAKKREFPLLQTRNGKRFINLAVSRGSRDLDDLW
jgi:hypothetical protein